MTIALFAKPSLASQVARLFARGEQGAWYDPSDLSTLFQDAAGTIPVTGVEQPVGRMLDKSGRGNHATQATATSRPVLSARVNLLTKTEELSTSPWEALGSGAALAPVRTDAYAQSPIGTQKATRLQFSLNGGNSSSDVSQLVYTYASIPSGAACLFRLWLRSTDGVSSYTMQLGVVGATQTITVTGQWSVFLVPGTGNGSPFSFQVRLRGGQTPANANSADILGWGADLRLTNDGVGLPQYQRVNTATDYDTTGFPLYLACDGVDDGMVTGNIDFGGTNSMFMAAGVRRFENVSGGVLTELSANYAVNSGTFATLAPGAIDVNSFGYRSNGTLAVLADSPPTTNPITAVIASKASIPDKVIDGRINGVSVVTNNGDQGAGNYGNYPLYLFRRGGTTLPFKGRFYGALIRGAQSTEAQIRAAERFINAKTRAW